MDLISPDLKVEMQQILSEDGKVNAGQTVPDLSDDELKDMYRWMLRLRVFDGRVIKLNRQGRLGFYAPLGGQEACQVASMAALRKSDWLLPSYRDMGASMYHGIPLEQVFLYSRGQSGAGRIPDDVNMFPPQIIIAAHLLHASGIAWASKLRDKDDVAISFFGDGATSQGDFHEALNFAAVYKLPAIFFCQNNRYAISVPLHKQMNNETIAQRALAYDMAGIQIDGNDPLAVYQATKEAADRARKGEGPTLIEALTYRLGPHTMSGDDPKRYRERTEEDEWRERDPMTRFRNYLESKNLWSDAEEEATVNEMNDEISATMKKVEQMDKGSIAELLDTVYAEEPKDYTAFKQVFLQKGGEA